MALHIPQKQQCRRSGAPRPDQGGPRARPKNTLREPKRSQPTIHPTDRRPYTYLQFGFGCHPVRTIQAQDLYSLPAVEVLQQDFATVGKAHSVAVSEGFGALLHKGRYFDFPDGQLLLQGFGMSRNSNRAPGGTHTAVLVQRKTISFRPRSGVAKPRDPLGKRCTTSSSPSTARRLG
jgi:hypothetical protein